jgi:predicted nucleic acid-binding protein
MSGPRRLALAPARRPLLLDTGGTLGDLARATEIDRKFADVGLGFVDAAVAAIGERMGVRRILTIDSDFAAIRIGRRYRDAFELAVPLD